MTFDAAALGTLELTMFPHWVCWRFEDRAGDPKPRKVPKQAGTGRNASSTDPSTWAPFDAAVRRAEHEGWGVGFVFHVTLNPFAGVDLDGARDPRSGRLAPWAQSIVDAFDSYAEVSPSGTGVKIVVRGKPRRNGSRKGADGTAVEVYGTARFFTLTGVVT
ncbi:MAG: hypothetical protein SF182_22765 [Deltaproteobacteria bacterium]|nr:hypothetical protein [Deltaproteobacteria bacterium]